MKKRITVQAAKSKGRKLQEAIATDIRNEMELTDYECRSNPASLVGMDIILNWKGKQKFPFASELKHHEKLNIWSALKQAEDNCEGLFPLLVFRRNHTSTYACLEWSVFLQMCKTCFGGVVPVRASYPENNEEANNE